MTITTGDLVCFTFGPQQLRFPREVLRIEETRLGPVLVVRGTNDLGEGAEVFTSPTFVRLHKRRAVPGQKPQRS